MINFDEEDCPFSIQSWHDHNPCGFICYEEIKGKKTERWGTECKPTLKCLKYLKTYSVQTTLDDFGLKVK